MVEVAKWVCQVVNVVGGALALARITDPVEVPAVDVVEVQVDHEPDISSNRRRWGGS